MKELVDPYGMIVKAKDEVIIDNSVTDIDLIDAYNKGVEAMTNKVLVLLNGMIQEEETPTSGLADAMSGMSEAAKTFFDKCHEMGLKTIFDDDVEQEVE